MSKVRITIIEADNIDSDAQFGLVRAISDLLARAKPSSATVVAEAEPAAAPAPAVAPEPVIDGEFPEVDEIPSEPEPAPKPGPARRVHVRSQEDIDDAVVTTLTLQPDISMEALAAAAYGADDSNARRKITWTLKRLATEGRVERLSATTWRVVSEAEQLERGDLVDDEDDESEGDPEELDLS